MKDVRWIGAVLALIGGGGIGWAMPPEVVSAQGADADVRPARDPFVDRTNPRRRGATPLLPTGISDFRLRGYIRNEHGEAMALLEIEGAGVHLVRAGETISLRAGQEAVHVRVERIAEGSAQVQIGEYGPVLEVR